MFGCAVVAVVIYVVILLFCDYFWLVSEASTASSPSASHDEAGVPQPGPSHVPRQKQGSISPRGEQTEPHRSTGGDFPPTSPGSLQRSPAEAIWKCYVLQST